MTATLTLTPNPIAPSGQLRIDGAGFPTKRPVRQYTVKADGMVVATVRPDRNGTWHCGATMPSVEKTVTITAQVSSATSIMASATVVVQNPVIVPAPPDPNQPPPPSVFPWSSLQQAIAATGAGGTIDCTGHTFTETVDFNKPMTFILGAIDGQKTRTVWGNVSAPDVFLDGMNFLNAALSPIQDNSQGSLNIGAPRFHWRNGKSVSGSYAAIRPWIGGTDALIENCDISGAPINLVAWECDGLHIKGGRLHHATGTPNMGNENGGLKIGKALRVLVEGAELDHNVGVGGWFDVLCSGAVFLNVKAHDNSESGLMVEMQDGAKINGCIVNRNAIGNPANAFVRVGGIFISSDKNVDVSGNTAAWNGFGGDGSGRDITIIAQQSVHPETAPYTPVSAIDNVLRKDPIYYGYDAYPVKPVIAPNQIVLDTDPLIAGLR